VDSRRAPGLLPGTRAGGIHSRTAWRWGRALSPPAAVRPASQEIRGGNPRGRWARIVNPVMNQPSVIRRRDAERLVLRRRAVWLARDTLRLLSHLADTAAGYDSADGKYSPTGAGIDSSSVYKEKRNGSHDMKRVGAGGSLVRWRPGDRFAARRFNPDRIEVQL
jgi:hypothetical protein